MKRNTNIRQIVSASLALLISAAPIAIAMEDKEPVRDHEYYKGKLQELEDSTRRIHEEIDRILAEFRQNMEEYYLRTGGMGATEILEKGEENVAPEKVGLKAEEQAEQEKREKAEWEKAEREKAEQEAAKQLLNAAQIPESADVIKAARHLLNIDMLKSKNDLLPKTINERIKTIIIFQSHNITQAPTSKNIKDLNSSITKVDELIEKEDIKEDLKETIKKAVKIAVARYINDFNKMPGGVARVTDANDAEDIKTKSYPIEESENKDNKENINDFIKTYNGNKIVGSIIVFDVMYKWGWTYVSGPHQYPNTNIQYK